MILYGVGFWLMFLIVWLLGIDIKVKNIYVKKNKW